VFEKMKKKTNRTIVMQDPMIQYPLCLKIEKKIHSQCIAKLYASIFLVFKKRERKKRKKRRYITNILQDPMIQSPS
jgi:pyruvate/2-oxoglutarate/acetoin dehydrogenase E1 component